MSDKSHLPMLAQPINWKKVVYPCIVQPKLDGIRCLAFVEDTGVRLQSRDGKPIYMERVRQAVAHLDLPVGTILDGELYAHDTDFNKLSGDVRRQEQDSRKDYIQYWVYDVMRGEDEIHTKPYEERNLYLQEILPTMHDAESATVVLLESMECFDELAVKETAQDYEAQGYEGAMIRTANPGKKTKTNPEPDVIQDFYQAAFYGHSRRSTFLMKVKTFEDAEATIIGVEEEIDLDGLPKGRTGKFVMRTPAGIEFRASGLTDQMKADSWADPSKYIGQPATYKFFGVSAANIPRHPIFKALRPAGQLDEAV